MQDLSNIVARINSLLNLAANNANENERDNANRAAQRLISKFQITQAQLQDSKDRIEDPQTNEVIYDGIFARVVWKERLIRVVSEVNGCFLVMINGGNPRNGLAYQLYGKMSNVRIVKILLDHVINQIEYLGKSSGLKGKSDITSFKLGCAQKVCERLREGRLEAIQEYKKEQGIVEGQVSTALTRFDNAIAEAKQFCIASGVKLKTIASRNPIVKTGAYQQGKEAGNKVDLNQPRPRLKGNNSIGGF